jgi:hypothetical protein
MQIIETYRTVDETTLLYYGQYKLGFIYDWTEHIRMFRPMNKYQLD